MINEDVKFFEHIYTPRAGGTTVSAVTRTLVNGDLSQTEVFLREAVQNSYDAKLPNKKPISIELNCYKLTEANADYIRKLFLNAGSCGSKFCQNINSSYFNIEITDRNTTGLIGFCGFQEKMNTSKDATEEKLHHFIYMTGNDEIKDKNSGGSFGFGKAALYKYSNLRTIVVYSRIKSLEKFQSRFIICRIDERVNGNEGRCWWGAEGKYEDGTTYAKPIIDEEADFLAEKFGMKIFADDETGTDILILNPITNDKATDFSDTFENEIPVLLTHWFWAKIVSPNTEKKIEFKLNLENEDISENIPNPEKTYPYLTFVRAYKIACDYYSHTGGIDMNAVKLVKFERPEVEIGGVFLRKTSASEFLYDKYISPEKIDWNKPVVALMRDVEFIVEYRSLNIDTSTMGETRCYGIFHTNRTGKTKSSSDEKEIEHYFRDIENQTHDRWAHKETLPYNFLKKVETVIPEAVKNYLDIKLSIGNTASISGLVAQKIGSKLGFGFGSGASDFDDEVYDTKQRVNKSIFTKRKQTPLVNFEKGERTITLFYDAKIVAGEKLKLWMIPVINTSDGKEIAIDKELKIILLTHIPNGREKTTMMWKPVNDSFIIDKSGIYSVKVAANIQCAFDISIRKEILKNG